jgi:electron transfer flavoprotein alpha subunit
MKTLVYIEEQNGILKRTSCEAVTAATALGADAHVVIVNGSDAAIQHAGRYGATACTNVELGGPLSYQAIASAITMVARSTGATVVLLSATAAGKDIAPRVSVQLEAGLLPDCVEFNVVDSSVQAVRPVYAGKARATVRATTPITVVTLRPNVFTARESGAASVSVTTASLPVDPSTRVSTITSVVKNEGTLDVAEADIIVSGGRGLKGPEHFHLVESLASALGGAVGASRAVVDAGWRPHREQVGQTGKTVAPTMYVACGISGAVQHLAGMSTSKVIVAVNKDKDAPIFSVADYGIIGDVFDVLPKLTDMISARS